MSGNLVSTCMKVVTPGVAIKGDYLHTEYVHERCEVTSNEDSSKHSVRVEKTKYELRTNLKVPRVGLMLVGWGGNNGSSLTASLIANKKGISWRTRRGVQQPNYFGSVMLSSTTKLGVDAKGEDVYVPIKDLLPMVDPNELVVGGWDISSMDLAHAMERAQVLEPDLQSQVSQDNIEIITV
jgi:myo-inositol-1-phosphate synthase